MVARRTLDLLPQVFQTETNKRFLNATMDQLIQEPVMTRLSSYVGRAEGNPTYKSGDPYVREGDSFSQYYQLEPSLIVRRRIDGVDREYKIDNSYSYLDLLNKISSAGGITDNHDRMLRQTYYNYQGFVDLEKLINYNQYYWVPNGPEILDVYAGDAELEKTFYVKTNGNVTLDGLTEEVIGDAGHLIDGYGADTNPTITLVRGGSYTFDINQPNYPFYVQTETGDLDNITDYVEYQHNISKREILGVVNNGEDAGPVTFNVPLRNAQDEFINMPRLTDVDFVLNVPFNQVQNFPLALFLENNTFDGIRSGYLTKRVIFTDTSDDNWVYASNFDPADGIAGNPGPLFDYENGFDAHNFDRGDAIPQELRKGIWQLTVDSAGIMRLAHVEDWPINNKIFVKEGVKYGSRYVYKDSAMTIRLMPVITANLDTLYYQSPYYGFGVIHLIEPEDVGILKISNILGKKSYISPNGIRFTNGLKVRFMNVVEPASYKRKEYVVEGVGTSIKLIDWNLQVTPEPTNLLLGSGYDASGEEFDAINYDGTLGSPVNKEYFTISRASGDGNPWSRGNRWFHKDLMNYVASINTPDQSYPFEDDKRAKRPIIEFLPDLYLYNGAESYYGFVDAMDIMDVGDPADKIVINDAFSLVEGEPDAYIDGVQLNTNVTVIFAEETDPVIRSTIYRAEKIDTTGLGDFQVHLTPLHVAQDGESIVVMSGVSKQGIWYRWNASDAKWKVLQQKKYVNQEPLFDVFKDGKSLSDGSVYYSSNFTGSKLFSYKRNTNSTTVDAELGFALSYRTIGNIGDILLTNDFDTDSFTYSSNNVDQILSVNVGNPRKLITTAGVIEEKNPWTKIEDPSKQYIYKSLTATLNMKNDFKLDLLFRYSRLEKNVFVYVNGKIRTDFKVLTDTVNKRTIIRFDQDLAVNDKIVVKIYGTSDLRQLYTIPKNLEKNSFNETFQTVTLGQIRNHLLEITENSLLFRGDSIGSNNLRDIDYAKAAGSILQHSAPVHFAQLMINNPSTDIIHSIDYNRREYARFKEKFLDVLTSRVFKDTTNPRAMVDSILLEVTNGAGSNLPFYYTDMVPYGNNLDKTSYSVFDVYDRSYNAINSYGFNADFTADNASYRAILIYHTRGDVVTQMLLNFDYSILGRVINILDSFDLETDDVIDIYEYESTLGCMIPATPSKLGIYPKFNPVLFTDNSYIEPRDVIQGHDGSLIAAFGDYRDDVILELEKRIYNNIKIDWLGSLPDHNSVQPSVFRNTGYSFDEWTQLLSPNFMEWVGVNNVDLFSNNTKTDDSEFSFNYAEGTDQLFGELLPGNWRAIYNYFYGTDRPHIAPWEMSGYTEKPSYWDQKYGFAPYTSGNTVMWDDLENGVYYEDTLGDGTYVTPVADELYLRPGLSQIIPVDQFGNLVPPAQCVVKEYNVLTAGKKWRFGDWGPVETAWRKSSEYPFAVMKAYALARPAEFCAFTFNIRDYLLGPDNQVLNIKNNNRKLTSDVTGSTDVIPGTNVWVRDRLTSIGLDVTTNLVELIEDVKLQLAYKMAGFTDKQYIKVLAEQSSPQSINQSVLVPEDNYDIVISKSAPTGRMSYSAVIVSKTVGGYTVRGYDTYRPYFTIIPSIVNSDSYSVTVGNSTATIYRKGDNRLIAVPYGTVFTSKQQVADFLISYGRYLTAVGFLFDKVMVDNTTTQDFSLAVKEFLFFAQQGWENNTVIGLTPAGPAMKFDNRVSVVDDLTNSYNEVRLLDSDGRILTSKDYRVYRDGTSFELTLRDQTKGIHLLDVETVQYEHSLIMDNITVFNDVIYESVLGNRQQRLKIIGRKTSDWNGSIYAPGFLVNHKPVDSWVSQIDYYKGDIVKHKNKYFTASKYLSGTTNFNQNDWYEVKNHSLDKKLIPSPMFNASQFESFYDVDTQDVNVSADIQARHSTGFQERQYFTDIGLDVVSQHKFYLGMIKEKGTKSVINKFLRAKLPYTENDITISEEWAVRAGEYGNTENNSVLEFPLATAKQNNGQIILELLNKNDARDARWNTFKVQDLDYVPSSFDKDVFARISDDKKVIPNTGPVLLNEVAATAFDVNKIENLSPLVTLMGEGSRIWVGSDIDNDWNIYRANNDFGLYATSVAKPNAEELEFTTARPHGFVQRDKIIIKNAKVSIQSPAGDLTTVDMSGIYRITAVSNLRFRVKIRNKDMVVVAGAIRALIYKMGSVRYPSRVDFAKDQPYRGWRTDDKVYIDDSEGKWQVLNNRQPWTLAESLSPTNVTANDDLGKSIVIGNDQRTAACSTGEGNGTVHIYSVDDFNIWSESESVTPGDSHVGSFGDSMSINDDNMLFVGAPTTNNKGAIYVLALDNGTATYSQILYHTSLASSSQLGQSVAASRDGKWLYASAPGPGIIRAYKLKETDTTTYNYAGDATNTSFDFPVVYAGATPLDMKVSVNGIMLVPYLDYTVNGGSTAVVMTTPPVSGATVTVEYSSYYVYIGDMSNPSSNNSFGQVISTSTDGAQILASASTQTITINGKSYNAGAVYSFDRTVENFLATGSQYAFTTTFTPTNITVSVDGIEANTSSYSVVGNVVSFVSAPAADAVISIETNTFINTARIVPPDSDVIESLRYGTDIELCPNNCSIYVGTPGYMNDSGDRGGVYRHVNVARLYGNIRGTVVDPAVTAGHKISINNFKITFSGNNLASVIGDINDANIPGVSASNDGNRLLIQTDSQLTFNRLSVSNLSGTGLIDLGLSLFPQVQVIESVFQEDGLAFGEHIAISPDAMKLMVGTTKATSTLYMTFDSVITTVSGVAKVRETTTYDGISTQFYDRIPRSGAAYLYEYQTSAAESIDDIGQFAYACKYVSNNMSTNDSFGRNLAISDNWVMIASPKANYAGNSKGVFYIYRNANADDCWEVLREQTADSDSRKIARAFIYNQNTNLLVSELPVVDSVYGKHYPDAIKDVKYITNYDPAVYNKVPNGNNFTFDRRSAWGKEHVGQIWWDINSVKYVEWQQGTLINKANTKDLLYPSSSIDIYEWTESNLTPSQYNATYGKIGLQPLYTVNEVYTEVGSNDVVTSQAGTKYYYWTKLNQNISNDQYHKLTSLAQALGDPRSLGMPYISVLAPNAVALYNCSDLVSTDNVLKIEYNKSIERAPVHTEWSIFDDGSRLGFSQNIYDKIVDSVAESDDQGRTVPDINLKEKQKYGVSIRPRQSVLTDAKEARYYFWIFANDFFKTYPVRIIRDIGNFQVEDPYPDVTEYDEAVDNDVELGYLDPIQYLGKTILVRTDGIADGGWTLRTLSQIVRNNATVYEWNVAKSQKYDLKKYWEYSDWYSESFSSDTIPTYQVDFAFELADLELRNNDTIKIKNSTSGGFQILRVKGTTLELIAQENATINLLPSFYDINSAGLGLESTSFETLGFSRDNSIEVRMLFDALVDLLLTSSGVFVDEFRKLGKALFEQTISIINSQFKEANWIFKTSFISIEHKIRKLEQIPVYVRQPEGTVEDYIQEIKPYHTKIRKYLSIYPGSDSADMFSTDFDLQPYLAPDNNKYRSPQLENYYDIDKFSQYPYKAWNDNHTFELYYIDVVDGGTGYTNETKIKIISDSGTGAKARVKVKAGGVINIVIVDARGEGFTSPPEIIIEGAGTGAKLKARLRNTKVRSLKTLIKFDRYTYENVIQDWQQSHSYSVNDLFVYDNLPYRVTSAFTSGTTIDFTNTVSYKIYRWQPYTRYSKYDIVVTDWANRVAYEVVDDFTTSDRVTIYSSELTSYTGLVLDNAADRTWSHYVTSSGLPGRDLRQLMTGLEYPGVKVTGLKFTEEPGYDTNVFDAASFDNFVVNEEGVPVVNDTAIDTTYYSYFTDANLGLRSEDIITDGSGFVDSYSSHAPEELLPGQIFDSLNIQVTSAPGTPATGTKFGPDVALLATSTGNSTRFPFATDLIGDIEKLIVWTRFEGFKNEGINFTVDWVNYEIVFPTAFVNPEDIVYITSLGSTGENIMEDIQYRGDGSTTVYSVSNMRNSISQQVYVKIDGVEVTDYQKIWDPALVKAWTAFTSYNIGDLISYQGNVYRAAQDTASGSEFATTVIEGTTIVTVLEEYDYDQVILFDTAPADNSFIQIHSFNVEDTRKAYSSIKQSVHYVGGINPDPLDIGTNVDYPDGYLFELPELMEYAHPWASNLSVRINNSELSPANNTYYTGDGSTNGYYLPLVGSTTAATISDSDIIVVVDNELQKINIDYTVYRDGSSDPLVVFNTSPAQGTAIVLGDSSVADYRIVDPSTVLIKSVLSISNGAATELQIGDIVIITQFSNHDMYDMRTQVFKGTLVSTVLTGGFDTFAFDAAGFDSSGTSVISNPSYTLSRPVTKPQFLEVYRNGIILDPVFDYRLASSTVVELGSLLSVQSTDLVVIRHYSEDVRRPSMRFRVFQDMRGEKSYLGISRRNSSRLTSDLNIGDDVIYVEDASVLNEPGLDSNQPGVVFINSERIVYWTRDVVNNTLGQIWRSTAGTGGKAHKKGSIAEDGSAGMAIPNGDSLWYDLVSGGQVGPDGSTLVVKTNGTMLQDATTVQANYLRSISR